ncbi:PhzF family phenazine biosynthesis isomerase [Ureibacillus manganicus]|uniref:Isomerase n=1 Tax=Ureibacillus manganicus DSM 26584 TaxID=1384049 RepID=A0A0A3I3Y3_9BACL|nr:PhzF family phenazine biosynthesis isomerase [Ureibacillus manganicus]KGR77368.1 isomerase [Ureibacillus manganicus DSM 26584]
MKTIKVHHYDAFSKEPNKGNPAGVVLDGDHLTEQEMQEIALEVGFNETSFALKSDFADIRIRYFTPGHENDLCGHATIATIYALKSKGLLGDKTNITIETRAGILPIRIQSLPNNDFAITMRQASPQFIEFTGSKVDLANSIGINVSDLHEDLPILYGSTGIWTLLVPIKGIEPFKRMQPSNNDFPSILKELPKSSIHPFCLESNDPTAHMHARHFSSPFSGTIEDPVTGTASGVMGAYYAKYVKNNEIDQSVDLKVSQGNEIGKEGRVMVHISKKLDTYNVEISGNAVFVKELTISYGSES